MTLPVHVVDVFASLHAADPDAAFLVDATDRVVHAHGWQATTGAGGFPEASRATYQTALAKALAGETQRFEWGEHGPGGVRSWLIATVTPVRDGDRIVGAAYTSCDATAHKRTEERLRRSEQLMVDTHGVAHLGFWEWDISEPTATWSEELYRIYGLTPETYTPSYEGYLAMVHPDDRQRVAVATARVFEEHVPYSHDERVFRPDGSIRHLHTWAYPILDNTGALRRLIGVCQDITDRKLAEEQVHELARDLERRVAERTRTIETSMRDLEAFNAMVSHDLRAPLQVIQSAVQLLGRALDTRPEDGRKYLEKLDAGVAQMSALVDALLALARVGSATLEREDVDLSGIAREVLADLALAEPGRAVDVRVAEDLRCRGDGRLLRAALQNLLQNAWKYSRPAEVARIEVDQIVEDGRPTFRVRDNGIGFARDEAERLFLPFVRLDGAREFDGTGIGLATVQRILERHGGAVWADAEPGRGATFLFTVP